MRLTFAAFFTAALFAVPSLSGAAPPPPTPTPPSLSKPAIIRMSANVIGATTSYGSLINGSVTSCPVIINFQGGISVSNWIGNTFQYYWYRSDGTTGPIQTVNVPNQQNAFTVNPAPTYTWSSLSPPSSSSGKFWVILEPVSSPAGSGTYSSLATFQLTCPAGNPRTGKVIPGTLTWP